VTAQGYEVSDNELALPLADFREKYSDSLGFAEYVKPLRLTPTIVQCTAEHPALPQRPISNNLSQSIQDENPSPTHRTHEDEIHTTPQQSKPQPPT
jgi:hypothetical protein